MKNAICKNCGDKAYINWEPYCGHWKCYTCGAIATPVPCEKCGIASHEHRLNDMDCLIKRIEKLEEK